MASPLTRSSRRSEGLSTRATSRGNVAVRPVNHNNAHNRQQPPNIGRKKRPRESTENEDQAIIAKKARIAIEIHPKSQQPKPKSLVITHLQANADPEFLPQRQETPPPLLLQPTQKITTTQPELSPTVAQKLTTHHQKVANGIKHELDRLQPKTADLKPEKRKLRSQEGTRFKSELAAYFPEYDEVIGNEPKEDHILNLDTPIIITDSAKGSKQPLPRKSYDDYPVKEFPDALFDDLHDAKRVDFSFLDKNYREEGGQDPLSDKYFETIHKKPERLEKTIRNTDKGRAQHEKDQVIRLLEGLNGHDWLKLMGVTGITESRKKEYEPAREHFISGCEAIIEKFKSWRDEEKRRKLEKEIAVAQAAAAEEAEDEDGDEEGALEDQLDEDEAIIVDDSENENAYLSDGDPPDYSDVDAMVARQLQDEAKARSAPSVKGSPRKSKPVPPLLPTAVEKVFVSFFAKPHLRATALGRYRRSGRSVLAWGQPVPEVEELDFILPKEYRDQDSLKLRERAKRRKRRVSKGDV